jgi:hypothetical protein
VTRPTLQSSQCMARALELYDAALPEALMEAGASNARSIRAGVDATAFDDDIF